MTILVNDKFSLIVVLILIICGGIGFLVWDELNTLFARRRKDNISFEKFCKLLSTHTKLVFVMTIGLIIVGTFCILIFEYNNNMTIGDYSLEDKLFGSLFLSISSRTAGMYIFSLNNLLLITKLIVCVLMLIGVGPGSTGGGMKVTTIAVLFLLVKTVARNKRHVVVFNREISQASINKAMCVFLLSILLIFGAILVLLLTEPQLDFIALLFNVISAISTTGFILGDIGAWSFIGKCVIILLMYIGRLTTVTMAMAIMDNKTVASDEIRYPEGNVVIG